MVDELKTSCFFAFFLSSFQFTEVFIMYFFMVNLQPRYNQDYINMPQLAVDMLYDSAL